LSQTKRDDLVLIEMGHNDNGDPRIGSTREQDDAHRSKRTLSGIGNETVQGVGGTVHTFGWYLRSMIANVQRAQAVPVLSGMVPTSSWTGGKMRAADKFPFAEYAKEVAKAAGPPVEYLDHTLYTVKIFEKKGESSMKNYFPNLEKRDNTHTNAAGARRKIFAYELDGNKVN
jgi:rhamnogalacturonan acetylesterase